jgi:hypothetical protein
MTIYRDCVVSFVTRTVSDVAATTAYFGIFLPTNSTAVVIVVADTTI